MGIFTTVFIDIDDTLLDFNACAKQSMHFAMRDRGLSFEDEYFEVFKEENNILWKQLEQGELNIEELYKIRFNIIFKRLGINVNGEEFEKDFIKYLEQSAVPVDGAIEILEYLSEKYYLCAASNAPCNQQQIRLKKAGMFHYFNKIFVSGEIGYAKPSEKFFKFCILHSGCPEIQKTMMIGDSLSSDIEGANRVGIKTCWFNKEGKKAEENIVDYEISALSEIKNIL